MEMMHAIAAMGDGTVKVVEVPKPEISNDYECLVRITACGLCSSTDLKIIGYGSVGNLKLEYPTLIGHEGIGVIEKIGPKVRNLKVGDRVVNPHNRVDTKDFHVNWGGMNEYAITFDLQAMKEDGAIDPDSRLARMPEVDFACKKIPEGMSDPDAVMLLTMKENYSALRNFGVGKGTRVLIFGDGAVALGLSAFAWERGAAQVVNVGHHDERLAKIRELAHVKHTINSHTQNVEEEIGDEKFDIVIDAVGSPEIILQGAKFLVQGGKVCVYGVLKRGHSSIDLLDLPNNVCVQMLNWPYREHCEHEAVIDMVNRGVVDPKWFYSHVMPVEDAQKAVDMVRSREAYKVILTMGEKK